MDGSASTPLAERTRSQISRAFVNRTANEANAKSALFEQLLNLSFTVQPPPQKQSTVPDSSVPKSSSADGEKKDVAKVDDKKDDQPTVAVVPLTPTIPLIAEKPIEPKSDQPVAAKKPEDGTLKNADLGATKFNEQLTTTSADSGSSDQLSINGDEQVVVAETHVSDSKVDTATKVTDSKLVDSTTASRSPIEDSSSKKVASTAAKSVDANANLPEKHTERNDKDPTESSVAKDQPAIAIKPEQANAQSDDREDRRGDRREKWFEHKDEAIGALPVDRPNEPSDSNPIQENADPAKTQSSEALPQPLTLAATSTSGTSVDPTIASPVALPATLSIIPQTSTASTPTPTATSTSGPESTNSVGSVPSRPIANQTAKTNSKEQVTEPGLSQQERVRVIQRIARSFNRISSEGGSINLRLHPEHLGSVSVQVRIEGRSLSARLSTETTAARDAIMQDLPALRQRLADQGFDVTKFQVDVAGNGSDASFAQSDGQSQNGQSQFGQSDNRSSGAQTDYRRVAANRESRAATTRQLASVTNLNWQSNAGIDLQA